MPAVKLSPLFNGQTVTSSGAPASGYKVYTYAAGSSTPLATYTDSTGNVAQANPIILNANGYAANPIWLQTGLAYKFVLKDANDIVVGSPWDNITGINDSSSSSSQWVVSGVTPTYVSTVSFTVPGDQTTEFHAGRRLQFTVTAGTVYGTITSSAYAALTTVTMAMDASGSLDSGLSAVNLSILRADKPALPFLSVAGVQKLINGGAEVAQGSAATLSTSAQYGQVDGCAMWASSGAVSAGSITQVTTSSAGRTGKAARASGVTLTGAGVLSWRCRLESIDAMKLKNQSGSFQIAVWHDVGSTVNYTIIVRKPNAADNYTTTTVISTSSAMAVPTGVATGIAFQGISLADCSAGIEIEVQAACGAVTTKNFDFTEWQLQEGSSITPFERRDYEYELRKCQRYYERLRVGGTNGAISAVGQTYAVYGYFKTPKRTSSPTINLVSGTDTQTAFAAGAATFSEISADSVLAYKVSTVGSANANWLQTIEVSARL